MRTQNGETALRSEISCPQIGARGQRRAGQGNAFSVLLQRTHLQNYLTCKTMYRTWQNNRGQDDPPTKNNQKEGKIFMGQTILRILDIKPQRTVILRQRKQTR